MYCETILITEKNKTVNFTRQHMYAIIRQATGALLPTKGTEEHEHECSGPAAMTMK